MKAEPLLVEEKRGKKGKFEEANGGTIFLDEIGEMPIDLQVHLLRVLQEKEITRLGSSKAINIDVKVHCRDEPKPRGDD